MEDEVFSRHVHPIKNSIPQWFKDTPPYVNGDVSPRINPKNLTMKHCIPFLDSLTIGYAVPLQGDVVVTQFPDGPNLSWGDNSRPPVSLRPAEFAPLLPVLEGYTNMLHFVWNAPQIIKLPKGYSAIVTHPFNRFDLPFFTLTAILDADSVVAGGSIPFFIKKDFEGVITAGTPILQIIPFKRESWIAVEDKELKLESKRQKYNSVSTVMGWYKKNSWKRKSYE